MYTISEWYGRTGNNLQQISNAIYFCRKNEINFVCPPHPLIKPFTIEFGKPTRFSSRFYFYSGPDIDFECDAVDLNEKRRSILLKYVVPHFTFPQSFPLGNDILVIHIRSGDVFLASPPPRDYIQNPLSFYKKVMEGYEHVIIVTEDDRRNPVLRELEKDNRVMIQASSLQNDFSMLLRSENLVTSGVGTFAVAAALCSPHIQTLYCTELFLKEHLNPTMLYNCADVKVNLFQMKNYIKIGEWENSPAQRELLVAHQQEYRRC